MNPDQRGNKNPNWKGGRLKDNKGYILVRRPDHHRANSVGYVFEHVLVYEEYYKCCIPSWVIIHHKNGIVDDNRIENLELMTQGKHWSYHIKRLRGIPYDRKCMECSSNFSYRNNWYRVNDLFKCFKCWHRRHKRIIAC